MEPNQTFEGVYGIPVGAIPAGGLPHSADGHRNVPYVPETLEALQSPVEAPESDPQG